MRRLLALVVVALVAAAGALALTGSRARGDSAYRVDVIFDTSKGIIPGQLVKIAGARVGTVKDVSLTGDYKARIEMEVERRFAPFRTHASPSVTADVLIDAASEPELGSVKQKAAIISPLASFG